MAVIKTNGNSMGLPMNIKRSEPIPLDASEIYYTKQEAETYARSGATAYVGQIIQVVEGSTVTVYVIGDTSGTLIKLADAQAVADAIDAIPEIESITDEEIIALFEEVFPEEDTEEGTEGTAL